MEKLAGKEWIAASHFHELSELEVLHQVKERAQQTPNPIVLLDLDSTLYEVGPRTFQILSEWCETSDSHSFPEIRSAFLQMRLEQVGYSLGDTFEHLGISVSSPESVRALSLLKPFWARRFFSDDYLHLDRPYPGAATFVRELYQMGLDVIYLTGRDEPGMGRGTRDNLKRDGFPWEVERTHLLLKDRFERPDLEHKTGAAEYVRRHGNLIASFENEPANLVALQALFPQAMHVFVETIFSDHGTVAGRNLYRIGGFGASIPGPN